MRFVFFAFCFIGLIHLSALFYGPIVKNHMLEGKMIELSKESRLKDDPYLMKDLNEFIDENHIDIDSKQIVLVHPEPRAVVITAEYEVYCKFWFLEKDYVFSPSSANPSHGILPDFSAY
jgi:hypothetical protein